MVDSDYVCQSNELVQSGRMKKLGPFYVPRILTNLVAGHIRESTGGFAGGGCDIVDRKSCLFVLFLKTETGC